MKVSNGMTRLATVALTLVALLPGSLPAASQSSATVITVGEMCGGCVKKITARLEQMEEIDSISCDPKAKTVTVSPKSGKAVSARALWDAMDGIGKTPRKLVGPEGTFTSKPKA